jgi:parallel beta-helix repeat protein
MARALFIKKEYTIIISLILVIMCSVGIITAQNAEKKVLSSQEGLWLYVGGSGAGNYTKIQNAIDNATEGDRVFVYSGWYNESILINKSILVCGENSSTTVIVGGLNPEIVLINNTSAQFRGFTVQAQGTGFFYGIHAHNSWSVNISDNCVKSCEFGIFLTETESSNVSRNLLLNCSYGIMNVITGNITITENVIHGNGKGSGIETQATLFRNYITRNNITNNVFGINFIFTRFNVISQNNFFDNQQQAFFITSFFLSWHQNYWNQSQLLPKLIVGQIGGLITYKWIPLVNFDWHPAQEPYTIT